MDFEETKPGSTEEMLDELNTKLQEACGVPQAAARGCVVNQAVAEKLVLAGSQYRYRKPARLVALELPAGLTLDFGIWGRHGSVGDFLVKNLQSGELDVVPRQMFLDMCEPVQRRR